MHTTIQLLDEISKKYGGISDYRIGKMLGVSGTAVVYSWRKGASAFSQDFALKVAALLEWDPAYVIACVERERAAKDARLEQTGEIVATWEKIAERFRPGISSILLVTAALFSGLSPSPAQAVTRTSSGSGDLTAVCIMRAGAKRFRRWLATIFPAFDVHAALGGAA